MSKNFIYIKKYKNKLSNVGYINPNRYEKKFLKMFPDLNDSITESQVKVIWTALKIFKLTVEDVSLFAKKGFNYFTMRDYAILLAMYRDGRIEKEEYERNVKYFLRKGMYEQRRVIENKIIKRFNILDEEKINLILNAPFHLLKQVDFEIKNRKNITIDFVLEKLK